jgi:hypothetical protein
VDGKHALGINISEMKVVMAIFEEMVTNNDG